MPLITVDLTNFNISNQMKSACDLAVKSAIQTSLSVIKDKWQLEAQRKLMSSRAQYLLGLDFDSIVYPYYGNYYSGAVVLKGTLPNMIETGFAAFDMKIGFSKSQKRQTTKGGGWYLTIPIRHSTPGAFMYGRPMPKNIYNQAKQLGDRQRLRVNNGQGISWTGYQHKNNIYDGMTRVKQQTSNGRNQSQYTTFRRASNKSDPASWMHPGYPGVKIAESLINFSEDTFRKALEANLGTLLK